MFAKTSFDTHHESLMEYTILCAQPFSCAPPTAVTPTTPFEDLGPPVWIIVVSVFLVLIAIGVAIIIGEMTTNSICWCNEVIHCQLLKSGFFLL